jgi:multiple sugar transport system substrate-binding protein
MSVKKSLVLLVAVAILLALGGAQCGQPQVVEKQVVVTKEVEKVVTQVVEKQVEKVVTQVVEKEVVKEVAPERIEITYWIFGSEGGAKLDNGQLWSDFYGGVINKYEETHPGIAINWALRGQESGGTTLYVDSAVAAGKPPDIYYDDIFRVTKFAQAGLLETVDGALTDADKAAYPPETLALMTDKDGKLYAIPAGTGYQGYFIDKTMFDQAGLTDLLPKGPDRTWTTDEFMKACKAINKPPERYCTVFFAKTPSSDAEFNAYLGGFPGCEMFDPAQQKYVVNSPACLEAMKFLHSLSDQGLIVPGPAGLTDDDGDTYMKREEIAMRGYGFAEKGTILNGLKDGSVKPPYDYLIVNYPNKPGAPPAPMGTWNPHVWSVFKQQDPKKLQAILDFINYMQKPDIVVQIAAGWAEVGVRKDTINPWKDDPDWQWVVPLVAKIGSKNYYYWKGVPCHYTEVRLAWAEARQAFWEPDADIQKILDDFVAKANGIIADCSQ